MRIVAPRFLLFCGEDVASTVVARAYEALERPSGHLLKVIPASRRSLGSIFDIDQIKREDAVLLYDYSPDVFARQVRTLRFAFRGGHPLPSGVTAPKWTVAIARVVEKNQRKQQHCADMLAAIFSPERMRQATIQGVAPWRVTGVGRVKSVPSTAPKLGEMSTSY